MLGRSLRVLVAGLPEDAERLIHALREGGIDAVWARDETAEGLRAALSAGPEDVPPADALTQRGLEEHIQQSQKMEMLGQLAAGAVHDFNNFLTIINSASGLLLENLLPGDLSRGLATKIHETGQRAAELVRQLLASSRREAPVPQTLDLNAVVAGTDKLLRWLLGANIKLAITLAPDLWAVCADPGQMGQVLMNLAVNARDAMPGGGRLTIETQNVELDAAHAGARPGSHVVLSVTDTGSGMPPEVQVRAFEPFFTTKGPGRGTGLGLATIAGIVKQSGGHIEVHSEVGVGTTFAVYLPRVEPLGVN